jgi:hypothetical protein
MKKITVLLLAAFAFTTVSCSKEEIGTDGGDTVQFSPGIGITAQTSVESRAVVADHGHFPLSRFGLWLESATLAFQQSYYTIGYDNILGTSTYYQNAPDTRRYTPRGASAAASIGLLKSKGAVTFYGMHPYTEEFDPATTTSLPFSVGITNATNYDYMYTGPVVVDPDVASTLTAAMPFKHAMTLIEFRLSTTYVGTLMLNTATLTATNGGSPQPIFAMKGTWDPRTGAVTPDAGSATDVLEVTHDRTVAYEKASSLTSYAANYTSVGFIVPAIPHSVGTTLKAVFKFQYKDEDDTSWVDYDELTGQPSEIEFDLDEVLTAGTPQGFMAGYRYIFNVSIDNFIKYLGYPVVEPWTAPDESDPDDPNIEDIIF